MQFEGVWQRAWVEIDLDALCENFRCVKAALSPSTKLCCVVKANAYGHGAVTVAKLYESLGADFFAVSNLEEALELRLGGITLPILNLGYATPESAAILAAHRISQCVFSKEYAEALSEAARTASVTVKIHLKLDSGMGRIGFSIRHSETMDRVLQEIETVLSLPALEREGVFTHFAMSDMGAEGDAYTREQFRLFSEALAKLSQRGFTFPIRHAANSAAIFDYPEMHLDMVRAGIVLYGYPPSGALRRLPTLTPALSLKGVVDMVKTVETGDSVSYGGMFVAEKPTRVATVPIGYADGFWRRLTQVTPRFALGRETVGLIGRICMDQCMLDVSAIPNVKVGDTVTFYGGEGESVASLAERLDTISYELITALGERLPRVYYRNHKLVALTNRILPAGYPIGEENPKA
ncbi:MAG: alanine racemase [Clostridia bacterium]|nr:alanine racemase [Clostridia bacterium]